MSPVVVSRAGQRLAVALAIDALLGEPPAAVHPVVWMGRLLEGLERSAPAARGPRVAYGVLVGLGTPAAWAIAAWVVQQAVPWWLSALVLKPTFAGRALLDAGRTVEAALAHRELSTARIALGALVSRPTEELDASLASAAAIESLAENFVDSWLAPLAMFVCGGLPLAYAYRAANTADAMWGYHTARYEWLGKGAARLDDACNLIPARLGAVALAMLSGQPARTWRVVRANAHLTASPNAGYPMAAVAGALDVRLEKVEAYTLHAAGRLPQASDVARARVLVRRAMVTTAVLAVALCR